jgi:hypothetical protein
MMRKIIYSFFIFITLISCTSDGVETSVSQPYFNLDSLVRNQIILLAKGDFEVRKTAYLNDAKDSQILKPDSSGWARELKLFRDADINKPSLAGIYKILSGPGELTNNLKERDYLPINPRETNIKYLKLFYVANPEDIRVIEAKITEENPLFDGETYLRMEFRQDGRGNLILQNYSLQGGQKMILLDSVSFSISGSIYEN